MDQPRLEDLPAWPTGDPADAARDPEPEPGQAQEPAGADTECAWEKRRTRPHPLSWREGVLSIGLLAFGLTVGLILGQNPAAATPAPASAAAVSAPANITAAIRTAQDATATITATSISGNITRGAGTVIGDDGYIVTADDVVITSGTTIQVTTADGRIADAEYVATDRSSGLTVLRVTDVHLHGFRALAVEPADGSAAAIIGENNTATTTTVASPHQAVESTTGTNGADQWTAAVRLSAPNDDTADGGPVITSSGQLAGIAISGVTTGRPSDPDGKQYAIDPRVAVRALTDIISGGVAEHGYLGLNVTDSGSDTVGAVIVNVAAEGPAATAGLRKGDLIVGINGTRIADGAQLAAQAHLAKPGTTATIAVLRDGMQVTTTLTVGTAN
ncbi:S1C family serine protease [Curtobacterium sp. MCBD17_040]|uniref:S1C family serine protease n=1 Tax=Curtobacterium sp. MCBD17_040 TaxID=2175674 RepID=UPI0011B6E2CD|nr:S1C family serine protease [Curtobacterium sp. MCBD17_040]WIB65289.1 S1C family serine protease [Curtobacterium sp. MCBD17_040]